MIKQPVWTWILHNIYFLCFFKAFFFDAFLLWLNLLLIQLGKTHIPTFVECHESVSPSLRLGGCAKAPEQEPTAMQCRRCGRLDFDMEPGDMESWQFRFSQKEMVFPKSKQKSEELHMNIFSGWWQLKYFLCSSLFREDYQFDLYFSDGLKPPTSYWCTEEAHLKQKKHAYFGYSHVFTCVCVWSVKEQQEIYYWYVLLKEILARPKWSRVEPLKIYCFPSMFL